MDPSENKDYLNIIVFVKDTEAPTITGCDTTKTTVVSTECDYGMNTTRLYFCATGQNSPCLPQIKASDNSGYVFPFNSSDKENPRIAGYPFNDSSTSYPKFRIVNLDTDNKNPTMRFDNSLIDTVTQHNVNPIEKAERSLLIMATTLHQQPAVMLVQDNQQSRLAAITPALFLQ